MELPNKFPIPNLFPKLLLVLVAVVLAGCSTNFVGGNRGTGHFDTVVIDAGHGGFDRGAKPVKGIYEKDLTLDTAQRLARKLRQNGLHVIETRTGDYFVTLDNRVTISNRLT
ncbi:N-acetylmuramoyl-L-alanine amidase, partial [bacterium]|nr:N-acetylmuramoyl-L-alanine amidase [bacterium]